MKKLLLTTALTLMGTAGAFAAKANPKPITVVQSDGTTLTIYRHGDENFHWTTAEDGTLLVPVGKYYYVAQVETDGTLKATPQLAHNSAQRSATERIAVTLQDKDKFLSTASEEWTARAKANASTISTGPKYFPHTGTPKALVILVQFNDMKFTSNDPKTVFDYFFNAESGTEAPAALTDYYQGTNYGSVKEYFKAMSDGAYTPQFDVAGVVTLSNGYAYYGQNRDNNDSYSHYTEMIKEACKKAQSELGVNFKDYDQDGNGQPDLIYFVYAGLSENNGGDANTIWAKTLNNALYIEDGLTIQRCTMTGELNPSPSGSDDKYITGIGVFCHEFTHCLGIPDLYATSSSAYVNNQTPEYWDLLDAGEYMQDGYLPTAYSPWETSVMEWNMDIETLDEKARQITMKPYFEEKKVYKIMAPDSIQYLLLQNIQKTNAGWWKGYPYHGLLIHRIDYEGEVNLNRKLNNTPGSPNVTILPADGIIINGYLAGDDETYKYTSTEYIQSHYGDPFPGKQEVTSLTEVTLNKGVVDKDTVSVTMSNLLYNIKETNGIITFDYLEDSTAGIDHAETNTGTANSTDKRIFSIDGRYVGTDSSSLPKGVYIIGKKKVTVK